MEQARPVIPVALDRDIHEKLKEYVESRGLKIQFCVGEAVKEYLVRVTQQQGK